MGGDIIYLVRSVQPFMGKFTELSLKAAVMAAVPSELRRLADASGTATLREVLENLLEEFNSIEILLRDNRDLEEANRDEARGLVQDVMTFVRKVMDLNYRISFT